MITHHTSLQESMTNLITYAQAATHDNTVGPPCKQHYAKHQASFIAQPSNYYGLIHFSTHCLKYNRCLH